MTDPDKNPHEPVPGAKRLKGYRVAIIVLSDRAAEGIYEDKSGPVLEELVTASGADVFERLLLPDGIEVLSQELVRLADSGAVHLILTSGGTGFSPRDVTPEATRAVIERYTPGIDELIRGEGRKFTPLAAASRAVSGIRGRCLIINLSGSPRAVEEQYSILMELLPHVLNILHGSDQ